MRPYRAVVVVQGVLPCDVDVHSAAPGARGLHSSTFQLNLSALYGIRRARRGCVARIRGVLGGFQGV